MGEFFNTHRDYHYLSHSEIDGGKRISQHLSPFPHAMPVGIFLFVSTCPKWKRMNAKLVALSFSALLWLVAWSIRFLPTRLKSHTIRLIAGLSLAAGEFGILWAQMSFYRSLTGIRVLTNDHFFMIMFFTETVVAICLVLRGASGLREKEKNQ